MDFCLIMNPKHLIKRMHKKSLQSYAKVHVVACAISRSGNLLGISMSTPVKNRHDPTGHAEWKLMTKFGKGIDTIYIARFSKRGLREGSISPCKMCSNLASRLNVRIISLTNGENNDEIN